MVYNIIGYLQKTARSVEMDMTDENAMDNVDILARGLLDVFAEKGLTFAAAESCTGGMILSRLTAIAGSSSVVEGGVVSYSNCVKEKVLGVKSETLLSFGAVSEETAAQMAEGVKKITGADIAVSVTGIAGPDGGSDEKPVGTVCFGISTENKTKTETKHFGALLSREKIRRLASDYALTLALSEAGKEI